MMIIKESSIKPTADDIKRVKGMGFLNMKGTDCFNARVLTRNGKITTAQAKCIAEAAEIYGSGEIVMTTRLTQEVIGVPYDQIEAFQAYLAKEGLETGGTGPKVRPVVSCKGTTCQYGLYDTYALSEKVHEIFYKGYRAVKLPHKFKIAVGGCPNNCVKPSLNDIGIVGQRIPHVDMDACRGCKKCQLEVACPIHLPKVVDGKVYIDPEQCNQCGRCITKCPFHANDNNGTYGYAIYVGGRWGKKTAHAKRLTKLMLTEEEVLKTIEKTILFFGEQGQPGERLADTINRLGFDYVNETLLSDDILARKEEIIAKCTQ